MIKIVTVEEMVEIEQATAAAGVSYADMMQHAGGGLARVIADLLGEDSKDRRVAMIIGPGNNGGDGLTAATFLKKHTEAEIGCYLLRKRSAEDDPVYAAAEEAGVFLANPEDDMGMRVLRFLVSNADIVVDALLGTGVELPLRNEARRMLSIVENEMKAKTDQPQPLIWPSDPARNHHSPRALLVAADCPSGLDCNTGKVDSSTLKADITVTFESVKRGMLTGQGPNSIGQLVVAGIGAPDKLDVRDNIPYELTTPQVVRKDLPQRSSDSHKGTYGTALIAAGSENYIGAALLAGEAAYRIGAGLVTLAVPRSIQYAVAGSLTETTWLPLDDANGSFSADAAQGLIDKLDSVDTLLVGPGLGQSEGTAQFLTQILLAKPKSLILDADALNILSSENNWWDLLPENTIITPHPGEMARLAGEAKEAAADRILYAAQKASDWNCIVVLKGAYTVCASPDGHVSVSPFAVDALATAGTGDVLAGSITGLLAQGRDPFDAAVAAVYIHALAGKLASNELGSRSVIAGDVLRALPDAIRQVVL